MEVHSLLMILTMSAVTVLLRVLPFMLFAGKETPPYICYLGKALPYGIMAMLLVYCLCGVKVWEGSRGLPEAISCIFVIALHLWKKNTLLSVGAGTLLYMLLVQKVFVS